MPSAPVLGIDQLLADPQLQMRDMLVEVEDPIFGKVTLPATPMRFSETTVLNPAPPPLLGQYTEEILATMIGLNSDEIKALRAKKVI